MGSLPSLLNIATIFAHLLTSQLTHDRHGLLPFFHLLMASLRSVLMIATPSSPPDGLTGAQFSL
jgi:hypothetical protein